MYHRDEESNALSFIAGLSAGLMLGASLALLLAPRSGKRTRRRLRRKATGVAGTAGDRWEDLTDELRSAVNGGRRGLPF